MNPNLARTLAFRAVQKQSDAYADAISEKDRNCCTVNALAALTGIQWIRAYEALRHLRGLRTGIGRRRRPEYRAVYEQFGFTLTRVSTWSSEGRFLVFQVGHVCAVMDGRPVNGLSNTLIEEVYRVERRG